ncbi:hypothetical protein [Bdellovibrio reynosensis]|uniref:Uncharacterized protein n=1 Tax=Bdellovibrio reynosensis TaxID=2835041 RepID=A0ABY4CFL2_9BACT|nr:hypothetical protein [Bdellovibrio reynosensis]UOF01000.1 hypothetical protein MNR06_14965 [Bdellovibrio reynosensis]
MKLLGIIQNLKNVSQKMKGCLFILAALFLAGCSLEAKLIPPKDIASIVDEVEDSLPNPPASAFIPVEKVTTSNGYELNTTVSDFNETVTTSNGYTFKGVLYE